MRRIAIVSFLVASLVAHAVAEDTGFTGYIGDLVTALRASREEHDALAQSGSASDRRAVAVIDRLLARLARPAVSASYAAEVRNVAAVARTLSRKLPGETAAAAALQAVAPRYDADVSREQSYRLFLMSNSYYPGWKRDHHRLSRAGAALETARAGGPVARVLTAIAGAASRLAVPAPEPPIVYPPVPPLADALVVHPNGAFLHVLENGIWEGVGVRVMSISSEGALSDLDAQPVPAAGYNSDFVIDPSGRFLYVGDRLRGRIVEFAIGDDGRLSRFGEAATVDPVGSMQFDPSGHRLFAITLDSDSMHLVALTPDADGHLALVGSIPIPPHTASLAVRPSGEQIFVASPSYLDAWDDVRIDAFGVDSHGGLDRRGGGPLETPVLTMRFHPSGDDLYAVQATYPNVYALGSLVHYRVGHDGTLSRVASDAGQPVGKHALSMTMDSSGRHLYVGGNLSETVSQFTVNGDGSLTAMSPPEVEAHAPISLAISPNGAFLFSANAYSSATGTPEVDVFSIGPDGALAPIR